jgi:pyridoxal/pyridoxine/pyridoxamine kinase
MSGKHQTKGRTMDMSQFRDLYHMLYKYEGVHTYQEILLSWMSKARQIMCVLQDYGWVEAMPATHV